MQEENVKIIHEGHQGIVRSKQLARDIMYWPGMNNDINDAVSKCARCQMARNNQQREPLMSREVSARP